MVPQHQEWLKDVETKAVLETLEFEAQAIVRVFHQIRIDKVSPSQARTRSLEQVIEWLDALRDRAVRLLEMRQGLKTEPRPLSEAIEEWLQNAKSSGKKGSTLLSYRKLLTMFSSFIGERDITSIGEDDIQSFLAFLRDRGSLRTGKSLSEAYIGKFVRTIRTFFNFCRKKAWIADTPMREIKEPDAGDPEPKAIEWKDFLKLMATTRKGLLADLRDAPIMLVMHDCGLRVGEVCNLNVSDLDLERNLIRRVDETKVKKERPRPITSATRQALRAWLKVRPNVDTDALFISLRPIDYGEPIKPGCIGQMLKRRAERGGVTGRVNPHSFRHARGQDHIICGGDTTTGAKLLGHSSEKTFSNFYARFGISDLQEKHSRHNSINARLGYAELGTAEEEEIPPPEFIADIEIVRAPGRREVQRYFNRIFDNRRQMSLENLLDDVEGNLDMLESLLDYCGLDDGFGFQVVFPPVGFTLDSLPSVEGCHLRVSDVVIEKRPAYL